MTDKYPEDTTPNIDIPVPAPVKAINDPTIQVPKQRPSRQYLSNTTRHNANGDYGEGYQHGYEAGIAGYGNGEGYDDCYGGTSAQYRSGYEDGYNDGYNDGLVEYEEAQERERIRQRSIFGR